MKILSILCLAFLAGIFALQVVVSVEFDQDISQQDKQTFDEILEPVMKIYNLVKYSATVIAVIVLLFAGITYITSGSDPRKREQAKSMATYVVIGLVVIWAAPMIVNFIVG